MNASATLLNEEGSTTKPDPTDAAGRPNASDQQEAGHNEYKDRSLSQQPRNVVAAKMHAGDPYKNESETNALALQRATHS